jgi:SAM-dependent methyltransferase
MTHEEKIRHWIGEGKAGTEIGPGSSPLPGFSPAPIYVDCFKKFGTDDCRADFFGDACHLPFHDHSLDYVAASHVLEHVANPVAALAEWYRVLRPGGIIYLVVPDRRGTWEHQRGLTSVDHMLDDFVAGTNSCDATHIDEFVYEADWSRFSPDTPPEKLAERQRELAAGMHAAVERGEAINIHFHTFEPSNVQELFQRLTTWPTRRFQWELLDLVGAFPAESPNGVLAVVRVHKGWHARAEAEAFQIRTAGNPRAAVRDDAEPFSEWARKITGYGGVL